jgi:hypothetical protein
LHGLAGVNGYFSAPPGIHPVLIRDGRILKRPHHANGSIRDPRTGFGITQDGTALLVTVDGRQTDAAGMTLREFAILLRSLGAVWAVNLDGGASTTMVVGPSVVNSPADPTGERRVLTSVVLMASAHSGVSSFLRKLHRLDGRIVLPASLLGWFSPGHDFRLPA